MYTLSSRHADPRNKFKKSPVSCILPRLLPGFLLLPQHSCNIIGESTSCIAEASLLSDLASAPHNH